MTRRVLGTAGAADLGKKSPQVSPPLGQPSAINPPVLDWPGDPGTLV